MFNGIVCDFIVRKCRFEMENRSFDVYTGRKPFALFEKRLILLPDREVLLGIAVARIRTKG